MIVFGLVVGLLLNAEQPVAETNTVAARAAFAAGEKLFAAGKYSAAAVKFEEAFAAKPHPVMLFNIGKCHERLNNYGKALRAFRDYLRTSTASEDRDTVLESIARLEKKLRESGVQQLLVFTVPERARVSVDGQDVGPSPASVELGAGLHHISARATGYDLGTLGYTMQLDRVAEVTVSLRETFTAPPAVVADFPSASVPPPEPKPQPVVEVTRPEKINLRIPDAVWPLAMGGLAVGASVLMFVGSEGDYQKLKADPSAVDAEQTRSRGRTFQILGWVVGGLGVAAVATGVVLAVLPKDDGPSAHLVPIATVTSNGAAIGISGEF